MLSIQFQSTLPRRERRVHSSGLLELQDFNPRSREGSDRLIVCKLCFCLVISIHAPAKGATELEPGKPIPFGDFNPRSREGSDVAYSKDTKNAYGFQSTLPRRERLRLFFAVRFSDRFQSTLPRRERLKVSSRLASVFLFQSTLPRRERLGWTKSYEIVILFQSTLPRRERRQYFTKY